MPNSRPLVLITGAAGYLGRAITDALSERYRVVGLDMATGSAPCPMFMTDFSDAGSITAALNSVRDQFGEQVASVIHLAAYFDPSGEDNPLYQSVNVEGTRNLLRALEIFDVEQFIYASTMLVHAAGKPGQSLNEHQPLAPAYIYPRSKWAAEEVLRTDQGGIPYLILRLAGVYDETRVVPTMAQQIARIRARDLQSHLYAGSPLTGQSALHKEDMVDALVRTVDRRGALPSGTAILVGESEPMSYGALQHELACLIHGENDWLTLSLPRHLAAVGAWGLAKLEPLLPDTIDGGEPPAVRPYMALMGDAHYALDTRRAKALLGWTSHHRLRDALPGIVQSLQRDPAAWYKRHGLTPHTRQAAKQA